MNSDNFKITHLRAFLVATTIAFMCISIFGVFGSTEMHARQHDSGISFSTAESSFPADHLEDLVVWNNLGSIFSQQILGIFLALVYLLSLTFFPVRARTFFRNSYAERPPEIAYINPPPLYFPLKEAFSRGLLNGKAF